MDADAVKKALNELYPHLEWQETQIMALLEFMRAKGIITDQEFAPFVEEAGKRSSVKWLAARLRIEHALSESEEDETAKPAAIGSKPPVQEPEEQPPQENESWQASEKAEEKNGGDREERESVQAGKRADSGEQPPQENESWQASDRAEEKPGGDGEKPQPEQTGKRAELGGQPEEEAA